MTDTNNDLVIARDVFARHAEIKTRGHDDFCRRARLNEDYYLGGGLQWRELDRLELESEGRPVHEINDIMPAVNAAGGYQIANRMDIAYLPVGQGTDEMLAKVFSKYAKHCLDNTSYRDHESDVFMDGLIQQRGFFDIRMDYQTNTHGEIAMTSLDPMDVGVDPDATGYDPDTWSDVEISRWLTARQIEGLYGKEAAQLAAAHAHQCGYSGNRDVDITVPRASFGDPMGYFNGYGGYGAGISYRISGTLVRYLVIERQSFEMQNTLVAEYRTGDLRVMDGLPREMIAEAITQGAYVSKRRIKRVRWETVLPDAVLYNDIVPYENFSVVPYFPYFRRGRTRGLVDNAISPQDMTNKFVSQYAHVVNSSANGGWDVEEEQLINMTPEQLEQKGSQTGLVIVRKKGTPALTKIQPNAMPTGLEKMIEFGAQGIQRATGFNESMMGGGSSDMSGVAIQSRQFAAQQQLAIPLWRLSQTRRMVGDRVRKLIQRFMLDERTVRVTEIDQFGVDRQTPLTVNQVQPDGSILHDMTVGEYDIAITEQPMQVTFDNSQFEQIKSMRKDMGVAIPDSVVLRYSTLPDKAEIAQAIKDQQAQQADDPVATAKAALNNALTDKAASDSGLAKARAELLQAQMVQQTTEALFSAGRVAQMVVADPPIAKLADALYRSAGGIDHDAAPVIETPLQASGVPPPASTHPLTPDHPGVGVDAGLTSLQPPQNTTGENPQ